MYPDGRKYDGEVDEHLLPTGKGTILSQHKKCIGTFDKGLLEGRAEVFDLHSGDVKCGLFRAGRLEAWVPKDDIRPNDPPQNPSTAMANPKTIDSDVLQPSKPTADPPKEESSNKPAETPSSRKVPAPAKPPEKKRGCCIC